MARKKQGGEVLYLATKRHVAALLAETGEELWRTKLPHGDTLGVLSLLVKGDWIFAAGGGHVHGLWRETGEIIWSNDLPKLGYQSVILAMEGVDQSTSQASQAHWTAAQAAAAAAAAG